MSTLLITPLAALVFMAIVFTLWTGAQLLAEKRLGYRAQGCKGPARGPGGEARCCKGGGRLCEETDNLEKQTCRE
ncbi:MAG: hypothetical protein GX130_00725 [Candidatus Hydrogenedens sp.]|nr:hypothetical protein [Candidatus Hydrogenedens sp.]